MPTGNAFISAADIGRTIREARKRDGLTQAEVALAAGVGLRFIGELEGGKATAQIGKILQVLAVLGGSLSIRWNDDRA